jgi:hypothetical protein
VVERSVHIGEVAGPIPATPTKFKAMKQISLLVIIVSLTCLILFGSIIVTALATIALAYIAWQELGGVNKVSRGEFIYKLKKDFFNDATAEPYFEIQKDKLKLLHLDPRMKADLLEKSFYSAFDIDNKLLGHFEDIASFEKEGLIDIKFIYDEFDWYMEMIWNNGEIARYIEQQNKNEETKDIYEGFKYIFEKVVAYRKTKGSGSSN